MFQGLHISSLGGGPNFSEGVHILQGNKFWGVLIYQKISSGGNQFGGVHLYHDKPPANWGGGKTREMLV